MGIFTLVGQFSVVGISIMGWSYATYGSFTPSMLVMAILLAVFLLLLTRVKESPMIEGLAKQS